VSLNDLIIFQVEEVGATGGAYYSRASFFMDSECKKGGDLL
jgi:hypothetical protein